MIWPLSFSSPKSKKSLFSLFLRSMIISSVRASHFLAAKNLFFVSAGASSFLLPAAAAAAAARSFPPLSCLFSPKETLFSFHHLSSLSKCTRINICCQVVFQKKRDLLMQSTVTSAFIQQKYCWLLPLSHACTRGMTSNLKIPSSSPWEYSISGILFWDGAAFPSLIFLPGRPWHQAIAGTPTPPPISYT